MKNRIIGPILSLIMIAALIVLVVDFNLKNSYHIHKTIPTKITVEEKDGVLRAMISTDTCIVNLSKSFKLIRRPSGYTVEFTHMGEYKWYIAKQTIEGKDYEMGFQSPNWNFDTAYYPDICSLKVAFSHWKMKLNEAAGKIIE